jgi:hypothetical protein
MRTCNSCNLVMPLDKFYKRTSRGRVGFAYMCKQCSSEYCKKWRADNPDKLSEYEENRTKNPSRVRSYVGKKKVRPPGYVAAKNKRASDQLKDRFIKQLLCRKSQLSAFEIPKALIELKRAQLRLLREARK